MMFSSLTLTSLVFLFLLENFISNIINHFFNFSYFSSMSTKEPNWKLVLYIANRMNTSLFVSMQVSANDAASLNHYNDSFQ